MNFTVEIEPEARRPAMKCSPLFTPEQTKDALDAYNRMVAYKKSQRFLKKVQSWENLKNQQSWEIV